MLDNHVIDNEEARLNALRDLRLLDTPPSDSFDRITRLASRLLSAPVSTISLTDADRQWFKSRVGVDLVQIPRAQAPCHYAIRSDEIFQVPDLLADPRFSTSPLAAAGIRFYAGAPLITRSGYGLGTLCVVDDKPRCLAEDEQRVLRDLAGMVMTQIEAQNAIGRVDAVSGYPNQHQMFEDIEDLARRCPGERCVGLMLELVAPGQVSHGSRVLGAAYGEELIRSSAATIRRALGNASRLYQVGAMRSVVLLDDSSARSWSAVAADILGRLNTPISCAGIPITPDPAIGVCVFRAGEVKPRDVLRRLFNAADDARICGQPVAAYSEARDHAHARSFMLLNDIRRALAREDELALVYQPRVDLASGRCVGVEALLRWRHPTLGSIAPGEFIPLVEQTALAHPVTDWVLDAAIGQIARWRGRRQMPGGALPRVSINASALNLEETDFAARVSDILTHHRIEAEAIELEFTESALARDGERVREQLGALRRLGVEVAIDDFGTGYSSLSYLQQLPASVLKIDRCFIKALDVHERDQKLVRAMITMAHDLGYRVVAEGIEGREAYEMLAAWRCDEAQGFHISQPLPPTALQDWLSAATRLTERSPDTDREATVVSRHSAARAN
jgi:EAL domain-containing protein (putative c-di-GMP-specific phosphodiesterase class I)/GGDEF domain-containing protein